MFAYPIIWREILIPEKRERLWVYQFGYAMLLSLIFAMIWPKGGEVTATFLESSSTAFITWMLWIQAGVLTLMAPPMVAASITIEREQKSLELLLLSPISATSIVSTKCLVVFFNLSLIVLGGLPIFLLGLSLGGLSLDQLAGCLVVLMGLAALGCAAGALSGALFHSTLIAMLGGYVILGLVVGLIPLGLSSWFPSAWLMGSPFGMVHSLLGATASFSIRSIGPLVSVGCWSLLTAFLIRGAASILIRGPKGAAVRKRQNSRVAPLNMWRQLKTPPSKLIVWREIHGKLPSMTRMPMLLTLVLYASVFIMNLILNQQLMATQMNLAASVALSVTTVALALFMSTVSMVNERRNGDLDLLVMSEIDGGQIIRGKFRGLLLTLLPVMALPVLQGLLRLDLLALTISALILYAMLPPALLAGIEAGLRSKDLQTAFGFVLKKCTLLMLVVSAKFIAFILLPGLSIFVMPLLLFPALVIVFLLFRYANDYMLGPVVDDHLSLQITKGGTDLVWHVEEWKVDRIQIALATVTWGVVAVFVTLTSGRLIGVFFLFILGTGAGIAGFAGLMWLMKWIKAKHSRNGGWKNGVMEE
ncbi:MAG: hypothetical protein O3B01_23865 [Planctomycetota bacterium]|nr:hypothetical protein [Planctomycetota bacterium]MDA1141610.1 hypothetical protein [Planctomycetota bacterium]